MTVRIGMIGAGRMADTHAGCLDSIPAAQIAAVSDVDADRARRLAEQTGAAPFVDYREMLDAAPLDAVYICTPTGMHAEQAIAVAARGLPFFVEKPLTLSMREAWRVARAVERHNVLTCVGYHWRYTEAVRRARELLDGRALALTAAEWWWTLPPIEWLRDKDLGGGQVVDQTTHLTDLCQWFGGPVSRVYAAFTRNTYSDAEFHNWDGYSLTFAHRSGAVGSLRCTYALFREVAQYVPPRVDLIAREMLLQITPAGLTVSTPQGRREYPNTGLLHFPINQAFVSAVENADASQVCSSVSETLRSLALTLAANQSAETGQPVDLDAFMEAACP